MSTIPMVSGRSYFGCWTCRLRRKKCDEKRPSCSTCTSLEIACHGYGPRPEWMDRGELEREQALKVKRTIGQTKWQRRQRRHLGPQLNPPPPDEPTTSLSVPLPSLTEGLGVKHGDAATHADPEFPTSRGDLSALSNQMTWGEPIYDNIIPTESLFSEEHGLSVSNQSLFGAVIGMEGVDIELMSAPSESSDGESAPTPTSLRVYDVDDQGSVKVSGYVQKEANVDNSSFLTEAGLSSMLKTQPSPTSLTFGHPTSRPIGKCKSFLSRNMEENALFMDYLDRIFYIQYPFYHSSIRQGRGWLLSILREVKSAYHAALALSELYQLSTQPRRSSMVRSPDCLQASGGHYDLALQELQLSLAQSHTWSGTLSISRNVECLTCILQLMSYELFRGGRHNWQAHLGAAATLVPAIVQARMVSKSLSSRSSNLENLQQDKGVLHTEDDSAIQFLIGSFIWIDIISCASTRSSPFLELDHIAMLESAEIHLESLTGSKNWAMAFIFEISILDKWKKEAEKVHKLSMAELLKRGTNIEERLRELIANPIGSCTEITQIFALAALTYLHVVISGAYPELPEIMESVSRTIDTFRKLTDPKLLRVLVWPFCITGCLALEEQQAVFRDLMSTAEITLSTIGTCSEVFQIMEACWEMRRAGSSNCDWVSAMNKRGHYVLLI